MAGLSDLGLADALAGAKNIRHLELVLRSFAGSCPNVIAHGAVHLETWWVYKEGLHFPSWLISRASFSSKSFLKPTTKLYLGVGFAELLGSLHNIGRHPLREWSHYVPMRPGLGVPLTYCREVIFAKIFR